VLVDEEDDLETWQAEDDLTLVGRPAPRHDGAARAAGRSLYRRRASPGCCTRQCSLPVATVLRASTSRPQVTGSVRARPRASCRS
jgi:hypothetical protein